MMMKRLAVLVSTCFLLYACAFGPAISKSTLGNLEINVQTPDGELIANAELSIDGAFIGNLTARLPVIHAKRGERVVRVECSGFKTYEKTVTILGEPNHQVLNVVLEKK